MAKVKIKGRFYILLIAVVAVALLVCLLVFNRGTGMTSSNTINLDMNTSAVVIRDETGISVERYDRVLFKVAEGAQVEDGTPVAEVFKWGYSDDMMTSLITIQKQVLAMQMLLLEDVENPDLDTLQLQIEKKEDAIRAVVLKDSGEDLLQLENDLTTLLSQRIEYLKTNVQPTAELSDLYTDQEDKQLQLMNWKSEITAKQSGKISFYFDGYEQILSAEKLDVLNADLINTVLKGAVNTTAPAEDRLYRMVNDLHWYIAFVTPYTSPLRTVQGQSYTVVFDGHTDRPCTGTAKAPLVQPGGIVNILEFSEPIDELMSVRCVRANITLSASGISIPLEGISMKDGLPYVVISSGEESRKIEVEVLATNEREAIVQPQNPADSLAAGMRFKKQK
ncbi:MAG: HlyD family efflux transporter periplasmic adaptor subunit [Clostridia bacterium]